MCFFIIGFEHENVVKLAFRAEITTKKFFHRISNMCLVNVYMFQYTPLILFNCLPFQLGIV